MELSNYFLPVISIFLLIGSVSAYNVQYGIFNYNTLQPIENANVTLSNSTYETSKLTPTDGYVLFDLNETPENWNVNVWRSGFFTYTSTLNITNDTFETVYLDSSSTAGIIRLKMNDFTLSQHYVCLYFTSNGRLFGCYNSTDVITIHNNMNYTFNIMVNKIDLISSPTAIENYFWIYLGVIISIMIMVSILGVLIITVYRLMKRGKIN